MRPTTLSSNRPLARRYQEILENAGGADAIHDDYDYLPYLTKELDRVAGNPLTFEIILKVLLWKIDRYPQLTRSLLNMLGTERRGAMSQGEHSDAEGGLERVARL